MAERAPTSDVDVWRGLLRLLSDDELASYGSIALDQYDRELHRWWTQVVMLLAAVVTVGLTARGLVLYGFGRIGFFALGFSWMLGYWPYRSAKTRALWWGHYAAVLAEQARRAKGGDRVSWNDVPDAGTTVVAPGAAVAGDGRGERFG